MPRYFFHTEDGDAHQDEDGTELAGPAQARVHAIRYAGEVMTNDPAVLWDGREFSVEVSDETGRPLFVVTCHAHDAPRENGAA